MGSRKAKRAAEEWEFDDSLCQGSSSKSSPLSTVGVWCPEDYILKILFLLFEDIFYVELK